MNRKPVCLLLCEPLTHIQSQKCTKYLIYMKKGTPVWYFTGSSRCLTFSNEFHWATDFIVLSLCSPLLWLVLLTPHLDGAVLQYIYSFTVKPYADNVMSEISNVKFPISVKLLKVKLFFSIYLPPYIHHLSVTCFTVWSWNCCIVGLKVRIMRFSVII